MDYIGEEDARNATDVEDSSSMADHIKKGIDKGSDKSLASIKLLDDMAVRVLW